jgi:broad specificity phosphatase PhoE
MSECICDLRFAICDLTPDSDYWSQATSVLLRPRFSGVRKLHRVRNRFSGFKRARQTAEAVHKVLQAAYTLLKRGVNETEVSSYSSFTASQCWTESLVSLLNRKSQI